MGILLAIPIFLGNIGEQGKNDSGAQKKQPRLLKFSGKTILSHSRT